MQYYNNIMEGTNCFQQKIKTRVPVYVLLFIDIKYKSNTDYTDMSIIKQALKWSTLYIG